MSVLVRPLVFDINKKLEELEVTFKHNQKPLDLLITKQEFKGKIKISSESNHFYPLIPQPVDGYNQMYLRGSSNSKGWSEALCSCTYELNLMHNY